ncbi:glutamate synthase [Trichinella spiralis]|uniref:glutamate synthase n=1 Tax=Trichinella spiralis TaxID=6334 RepID=UPI0001EFCA28|nr:glutamate synthase [Trichinella spiralis]
MPVLINIPIKASTSASVAASCGVKYLPKYSIRQRTGDASISDSKRLYGITPMQDNGSNYLPEASPLSLASSESPESSDTWYKRLNSSSESVSGSDTSGSGRTTICLTVCPDFVCRKTVSKSMSNRSSVVYSQGKSQQSTSNGFLPTECDLLYVPLFILGSASLNCHCFETVSAFAYCIEHSIEPTADAVVE